jgi:hypothetical protein
MRLTRFLSSLTTGSGCIIGCFVELVRGEVKVKRKPWLALAVVSLPLLYLLAISLIPENKIVGFHWPR